MRILFGKRRRVQILQQMLHDQWKYRFVLRTETSNFEEQHGQQETQGAI